jgi:hypothetical protein
MPGPTTFSGHRHDVRHSLHKPVVLVQCAVGGPGGTICRTVWQVASSGVVYAAMLTPPRPEPCFDIGLHHQMELQELWHTGAVTCQARCTCCPAGGLRQPWLLHLLPELPDPHVSHQQLAGTRAGSRLRQVRTRLQLRRQLALRHLQPEASC